VEKGAADVMGTMDKAIQDRLLLVAVFGREVLGWEKELVKVVVERRVGHQVNYRGYQGRLPVGGGECKDGGSIGAGQHRGWGVEA